MAGKPRVYSCPGRSLANRTSDLWRAAEDADWGVSSSQGNPFTADDDGCALLDNGNAGFAIPAHSPGGQNLTQNLTCGIVPQVCGDGVVQYGEDCEHAPDDPNFVMDPDAPSCEDLPGDFICGPVGDTFECVCVPNPPCGNDIVDPGEECDDGDANSNDPNATCRENCKLADCGDGIVDPAYGEDCEGWLTPCEDSEVCFECACGEDPMGLKSLPWSTGPSTFSTCDSSLSLLSTRGGPTGGIAGLVCNGTQGDFTPGPIVLFGGRPDGDGVASLWLDSPVVITASLDPQKPGCGGNCVACWRFAQDPDNVGFVDCNARQQRKRRAGDRQQRRL